MKSERVRDVMVKYHLHVPPSQAENKSSAAVKDIFFPFIWFGFITRFKTNKRYFGTA